MSVAFRLISLLVVRAVFHESKEALRTRAVALDAPCCAIRVRRRPVTHRPPRGSNGGFRRSAPYALVSAVAAAPANGPVQLGGREIKLKGSTLLLKYIAQGVRMQLAVARLDDRLLYALKIYDDEEKAGVLWSILERDEEKAAISALVRGETCQTFLFNELAVNVAWVALPISVGRKLGTIVSGAATGQADHSALKSKASLILDGFHNDSMSSASLIVADIPRTTAWNPVFNHFITSHATSSLIDLFNKDEGNQQEQIGIWLTDNLHHLGVHHSPQVPKGKGFRELTDILLSHQFGSVLIESKVLTILARNSLPGRTKLAHGMPAHITKAVNQLRGGIRKLKDGTPVTSKAGVLLDVERTQPMHGIVLIPDLDLIQDREAYGLTFIKKFMETTNSFLHLLDIAELLRIVQAAEMIAARGTKTTPMMAFDYYLVERAKKTLAAGTLCIEVLLRFANE